MKKCDVSNQIIIKNLVLLLLTNLTDVILSASQNMNNFVESSLVYLKTNNFESDSRF